MHIVIHFITKHTLNISDGERSYISMNFRMKCKTLSLSNSHKVVSRPRPRTFKTDQDQDFRISVSRRLDTKTQVSRAPSLVLVMKKILLVLVHWCCFYCLLTVGTSNWSEDYFVSTAGVGLVINDTETGCQATDIINGVTSSPCQQTMQSQLAAVFDRDWNSVYAHPLPN